MLKPLKQWVCDRCGEVIKKPKEGWVEWTTDRETHKAAGFKIVHHAVYSPQGHGRCYHYTNHPGRSDDHLDHFINGSPMVYLFSFLDRGPYHDADYRGPQISDMREFVEFARRLTLPYYEEARIYWSQAKEDDFFDGANEIWIYSPKTLETIVRKYGPRERSPSKLSSKTRRIKISRKRK